MACFVVSAVPCFPSTDLEARVARLEGEVRALRRILVVGGLAALGLVAAGILLSASAAKRVALGEVARRLAERPAAPAAGPPRRRPPTP